MNKSLEKPLRSTRYIAEENSETGSAWLLTFSDLLMLLLSLFVLRLSMASFNGASANQLNRPFGAFSAIATENTRGNSTLAGLIGQLQVPGKISDDGLSLHAVLGRDSFLEFSDELTFAGRESIVTIGKAIKGTQLQVRISGHAQTPGVDSESQFSSSWDISRARVLAVLRQLIDAGVEPQALIVTNFGDSKLNKIAKEGGGSVSNLELFERVDITIGSHG